MIAGRTLLSTFRINGRRPGPVSLMNALTLALAAIVPTVSFAEEKIPVSAPSEQQQQVSEVKKGQYLAIASDCAACHTVPGSPKLFAGGYSIDSPMGKIYSSNITPSKTHGIGNYSEEEFARAVREGVNKEGRHLYPAMPYPSYASMSDADVSALYDYFMSSVKPVDEAAPETHLQFPFNIRASMLGWNLLFLNHDGRPTKPAVDDVGRGKYLVDTLAHCSECHSPRNELMAVEKGSKSLTGGYVGSWYAPNITPDPVSGIGAWSDEDLVKYLKTGHVEGKAQAAGPMAEAITNSLQHLSDNDLSAMVHYLRSLPPTRDIRDVAPAFAHGNEANSEANVIGQRPMQIEMAAMNGQQLYENACASCHQSNGMGTRDGFYPSLVHNTALGGSTVNNLVSVILHGVERETDGKQVLMPAFGEGSEVQELNDAQIADLANYLFKQFGNPKLSTTAEQVKALRQGGNPPLIVTAAAPAFWIGVVVLACVVIGLLLSLRRARAAKKHALHSGV